MIRSRITGFAVFNLAAGILCCCLADLASKPNQLVKYVSPESSYILFKPEEWQVRETARNDALRIQVVDSSGTSMVEFFFGANRTAATDALHLMAAIGKSLLAEHPDLRFSEVYLSSDRARAVANISFSREKISIKGRYYFELSPKYFSVQGYCAPESEMTAQRGRLVDILSNLHFVDAKNGVSRPSPPAEMQPVQARLVLRQAPDGSLTMKVPADWNFLAGGGRVFTAAPGGQAGFVFTSLQMIPPAYGVDDVARGVIASPYLPPTRTLPLVFSRLGNRNVQVLGSRPDQATMQDSLRYFGRQCQAEDMAVSWVSREGAACMGAFKQINSAPSLTGIWSTILAGFWGPQEDFVRWVPLLEQVGASFGIDDQYARNYIQSGLANLRRLQEKTAQSMRELNQARYDNQAAWEQRQARKEASDARWDDYRRGQSYWVSDLEGGKIYATDNWGTRDTRTGDYYEGSALGYVHFEGQNPRHPSETMREISSYEVKRLMGEKP